MEKSDTKIEHDLRIIKLESHIQTIFVFMAFFGIATIYQVLKHHKK